MADKKLNILLTTTDQASAVIDSVSSALARLSNFKFNGLKDFFNQTTLAAGKLSKQMISLGKDMQQSGIQSYLGGKEIFNNLGKIVNPAMEVEDKLADVRKVAGLDPAGMEAMYGAVDRLSKKIPVAQSGLLEMAEAAGAVGVSGVDNLAAFSEMTAKMSTAWDMLPSAAGDSIAKLGNVFDIKFTPAGFKELTLLGDAVNDLADKTAAKAPDIIEVMNRVGGVAKENGFGLVRSQTAALSAAFLSFGLGPERSGTAINALLKTLQNATMGSEQMQTALQIMGYDAQTLEKKIKNNASGALVEFMGKLSGFDRMTKSKLLTAIFGQGFSDEIAIVSGNYTKFTDTLRLAANQTSIAGSVQREFEIRSATSSNKVQLLKNNLTGLAIALGNNLLPAMTSALTALQPLIDRFSAFAKTHPVLTRLGLISVACFASVTMLAGAVTWTIGTLISLASTVLLAYGKFGSLAGIIKTATMGAWAFGGALAACCQRALMALIPALSTAAGAVWGFTAALLANPVTWVVIGIGALIGVLIYLYQHFDSIRTVFSNVWQFVSGGVADLFKRFWYLTGPLGLVIHYWSQIKRVVGNVWSYISPVMTQWYNKIKKLFDLTVNWLHKLGQAVGLVGSVSLPAAPAAGGGGKGSAATAIPQPTPFVLPPFPAGSVDPSLLAKLNPLNRKRSKKREDYDLPSMEADEVVVIEQGSKVVARSLAPQGAISTHQQQTFSAPNAKNVSNARGEGGGIAKSFNIEKLIGTLTINVGSTQNENYKEIAAKVAKAINEELKRLS